MAWVWTQGNMDRPTWRTLPWNERPAFFKTIWDICEQDKLGDSSRLKETKETWLLSAHNGLDWTRERTKTLLGQLTIIGILCTTGIATFHWIWNYFKMNYYSTMSVYFLMPWGGSGFQTENTIVSFQLKLCTCLKGVATSLNAPEGLSSGDSR